MIPADVDVDTLRAELAVDNVAINDLGRQYPQMEAELIDVSRHAADSGFGKTGIVILDETPKMPTDVRDIAQELLNTTDYSAIIVRTPATGSVVSRNHSRAVLESAQWHFLDDPSFSRGARTMIDMVNETSYSWAGINLIIAAIVLLAIAAVIFSFMQGRPEATQTGGRHLRPSR
ncbi:Rv1476 family membrane protein [Corynebacterium epidermidicanis]|uniref:Uncharacterized protein n=1 Tax=Corynebacterium epidermidicanis TaxID=1050174 RepID=A0A0G3GUI1_9CORY|nr:DUF6676 family protein [Corynebacterium epidermidicanis]AKK03178.1 hypothetical protein CEPID_06600 [Corynebacterium epidermidicanis]